MRLGPGWRRAFRLRENRASTEATEELSFHIEEQVSELVNDGTSPDEARRVVLRRFGDAKRVAELCAAIDEQIDARKWRHTVLADLSRDVRYALRLLRKNLAYTIVAAGTLALGIGANTAMFSVVNAVLLRELPYEDPGRLVMVWLDNRVQGFHEDLTSYPNYEHMRDENRSLTALAAYRPRPVGLTGSGDPERINGATTSASFFGVLGIEPARGRTFVQDEDEPGAERVAVLSYGLWTRRFGSDESILGRTVDLDGTPHTVVGVMPPGFDFPDGTEIWTPLSPSEQLRNSYGSLWLYTIGRLSPETSAVQAQVDLGSIISRVSAERLQVDVDSYNVTVNPLHAQLVGDVQSALWILLAAVSLVLLVACANVANLSLARASVREGEMALRTALGAGRNRIVRLLLTESVVIALLGGVLGLVVAQVALRIVVGLAPPELPRFDSLELSRTVLLFTGIVATGAGVLFGFLPAIQASRPDLQGQLREGVSSPPGSRQSMARRGLVVVEMAVAVVLLVGAGLLVRSFIRLHSVDVGFNKDGLISMRISLPGSQYPEGSDVRSFHENLVTRIQALPSVQNVALGTSVMIGDFPASGTFSIEGREFRAEEAVEVLIDSADPELFPALGVPLVRGRLFDNGDGPDGPPVLLINETMSEMFWPDQDPVGQRITFGDPGPDATWFTVVGVVGNRRRAGFQSQPRPATYYPYSQNPTRTIDVIVRAAGDVHQVIPSLRRAVWGLDSNLPITQLASLESLYRDRTAGPRFNMLVLGLLASLALVMAAAGVYGVITHTVAQRTKELGLRMALGAHRRDVIRLVMGGAFRLLGFGLMIGVFVAFAATRFMSSLIYGVSETDVLTFVSVILVLGSVGAIASFLPAARATRLDAMRTLRD